MDVSQFFAKKYNLFGILFAFISHLIVYSFNGTISMVDRVYGNFFIFYINAFLAVWGIVQCHKHISNSFFARICCAFEWMGKNSLAVVCTSLYAIEIIRLIDYKVFGNLLSTLDVAEGIICCLLSVAIEIGLINICNRYLWFILGKRTPKSIDLTLIGGKL